MVVTSDGVDTFGISFTKHVHVVAIFFFLLMLDANGTCFRKSKMI